MSKHDKKYQLKEGCIYKPQLLSNFSLHIDAGDDVGALNKSLVSVHLPVKNFGDVQSNCGELGLQFIDFPELHTYSEAHSLANDIVNGTVDHLEVIAYNGDWSPNTRYCIKLGHLASLSSNAFKQSYEYHYIYLDISVKDMIIK